ncbi:hypothetical protein PG985_006544 [Apiospora marii]|uniref:Uncharacterized protein n=1 Tax=Apiospora marii TaxID=335849 RepID=A0ABR1S814_9PEZI
MLFDQDVGLALTGALTGDHVGVPPGETATLDFSQYVQTAVEARIRVMVPGAVAATSTSPDSGNRQWQLQKETLTAVNM